MSARAQFLALAVLLPVSTVQAQDAYRYGYIRTIEQGVTLQRASEAAAEVATANIPFLPGDRVWTDDGGRMEVQFADGSVLRLDSRSKLDYVSQDGGRQERAVLRLWSGSLILHVRDQRRSPDFIVESPEGVLQPSERGVYRLDVQPGEARVAVFEGEADVEAGRRVRVDRGQQLIVREGEPYAGPDPISGHDAEDAFARWDRDLEEQLAYADGRREEWLPEEVAPYANDFSVYGAWRPSPAYGNVWYPRVASGWRPYSQGYWGWTMYGWTWIPNERWGWATSHYGRWGYNDGAWFWIPGSSWGAGWVNWSVGGDHVGWCPLGWGDRPVYVRGGVQGHAVHRGPVQADTVPWTYVRRADMGQRDLARRRVDSSQVSIGDLHVAPAGQARLSRDLRLVAGPAGVSTGQPAAGGAVPRNVRLKSTPGDTVPELQADPKTTIRRPIPRRHREPEETEEAGNKGQEGQAQPAPAGSRVSVPRAPRTGAPWTAPEATAPRQQRSNGDGQVSTGQSGSDGRARDVQREGGQAPPSDAARDRGERDREILRPIFGPLSRPRGGDGAAKARPEQGGSERSGSDSERPRPSGVSSAPPAAAPAPAQPPAQRPAEQKAQPRERARPRDHN